MYHSQSKTTAGDGFKRCKACHPPFSSASSFVVESKRISLAVVVVVVESFWLELHVIIDVCLSSTDRLIVHALHK